MAGEEGAQGAGEGGESQAEALTREFQDLGLSPYEARVMVVLLEVGSSNSSQLARLAKVPRTSTYAVLESLGAKGLVRRTPGDGPAAWLAVPRQEVLERLESVLEEAQEQRLKQHRARSARVREMMARALPEAPPAPKPYIDLFTCASQFRSAEDRLVAAASEEILIFSRPPWAAPPEEPNATLLEAPRRGVVTRTLYQAAQAEDPEGAGFRRALLAYEDAGVKGRVADELPVKIMVVDRKTSLLAVTDPSMFDAAFPVTFMIQHPGFAQLLADLFELKWASARPTPKELTGPEDTKSRSENLSEEGAQGR